ncbi:unnamed protein product [Ceutorhynchus assimilis]|uniref:PDZ GRASP-type domain-containing protein n=1 Tax=Ceutorhynchus assimilis TaxID=467358 RepID=A0A9N9MQY1_9CUCU|nr:unnamed protein product [Ceutorhynchus assimilis]
MGNSGSVDIPGGGTDGYHVLRVQENSPGAKAGFQPFFDFIIAINGIRLDKEDGTLKDILKTGMGKSLPVTLYSCKSQGVRSVTVEPSDSWGGQGLLGISIKFCSFEAAKDNVWHILEVHPNSPADLAGLKPFSDYIIGSDSIMHESEDLYNLIENHDGNPLKLYVYNCDTDTCREVTITPNSRWGGEGLVGCGIGYGYLHRIPVRAHPPSETQNTTYGPPANIPSQQSHVNVATTPVATSSSAPVISSTVSAPQDISNLIQNTAGLNLGAPATTPTSPLTSTPHFVGVSNVVPPTSLPQFTPSVIPISQPAPETPKSYPSPACKLPQIPAPQIPTSQLSQDATPQPLQIATPQIPKSQLTSASNLPNAPPLSQYTAPPVSIPQFPTLPQIPMYNPSSFQPNLAQFSYGQPQSTTTPSQTTYAQGETVNLSYPPVNYPAVSVPQTFSVPLQPTQLIYDPTIAARSAQQLLSGNLGNVPQGS